MELPLNARLEDVVGGINERIAVQQQRIRLEPGILARADNNLLYIDEVNLLDDQIVDAILDAAAQGAYTVRRGAMSGTYRSRFVLIGSMNPEEGRLRPQILDRFGLRVNVRGLMDKDDRSGNLQPQPGLPQQSFQFCAPVGRSDRYHPRGDYPGARFAEGNRRLGGGHRHRPDADSAISTSIRTGPNSPCLKQPVPMPQRMAVTWRALATFVRSRRWHYASARANSWSTFFQDQEEEDQHIRSRIDHLSENAVD